MDKEDYNVDLNKLTKEDLDFLDDLVMNDKRFRQTGSIAFFGDKGEDYDYFVSMANFQEMMQPKLQIFYCVLDNRDSDYGGDTDNLTSCKYEYDGVIVNLLILDGPNLFNIWKYATNKMKLFCKNCKKFELQAIKKSKHLRIALFRYYKAEWKEG